MSIWLKLNRLESQSLQNLIELILSSVSEKREYTLNSPTYDINNLLYSKQ